MHAYYVILTYGDTDYPITWEKSIYYEITTVLKAKNKDFHNTFSGEHKSLVEWRICSFQPTDATVDVATLIILCHD